MNDFLLLILALAGITYAASLSSRYAERIAEGFQMSRYTVGLIVVSFVAIMPETFIAISASLDGEPSLGVGTLFGSNVIDLTLIIAILVFLTKKRGIRIQKSISKKLLIYPLFLTIPMLLGTDGRFSREEGAALIVTGIIFYYYMFRRSVGITSRAIDIKYRFKNISLFLLSMGLLLLAAHFTSSSAINLAHFAGVHPILIGILFVSFGTTLPELTFSAKAIRAKNDEMALGNILGSVLADATIVIGIVAMITPFGFPRTIAYVTAGFMVLSSILLLSFMRSKGRITRKEAAVLVGVWVLYICAEMIVNTLVMNDILAFLGLSG